MTDEHVELANLIMGRTTTAAVEAVLAAGYSKRSEQVTEIVADSSKVFMVVCQDPEAHARSYNEGYEAAVTQGLADDPSLAGEWLDGKLAVAFAYGWREGRGVPTPVDRDSGELLHSEALQPDFNPYQGES